MRQDLVCRLQLLDAYVVVTLGDRGHSLLEVGASLGSLVGQRAARRQDDDAEREPGSDLHKTALRHVSSSLEQAERKTMPRLRVRSRVPLRTCRRARLERRREGDCGSSKQKIDRRSAIRLPNIAPSVRKSRSCSRWGGRSVAPRRGGGNETWDLGRLGQLDGNGAVADLHRPGLGPVARARRPSACARARGRRPAPCRGCRTACCRKARRRLP